MSMLFVCGPHTNAEPATTTKKLLAKLQNVATLKTYSSWQKCDRVVGWVHSIVEQ